MTGLLAVPSLLGLASCLGVSLALWKRRPGPAWGYATLTGLMVALWCAGQAGWWLAEEPETRALIARIQYVGIATSPTLWLLTALAYVGRSDWLRPGRRAALMIVPILTIAAAATNDRHGLIWERIVPMAGRLSLDVHFGPWFYVHMIYSYLAGAIGSIMMAVRFASSPLYERPLRVIAVGAGLVLIANLLYLSSRGALTVDPTPLAFAVVFTIVGWAMVRRHLFAFLPLARGVTVEGMRDGLIVLDPHGQVVDSNPAARSLLGSPHIALGSQFATLLPEASHSALGGGESREVQTSTGTRLDMQMNPVIGKDGAPQGTVVRLRDVTAERAAQEALMQVQQELRRANQELERLALTDTLTGLANRRRMEIQMEEEFARARRHSRPLSFVMIDIDHFKQVNDQHGHASGDRVLSACGRALKDQLRPGDVAARLGGDEFGVVLPETSREEALDVARRLHGILRALPHEGLRQQRITVTSSFGVSSLAPEDSCAAELQTRADRTLYMVKESGRDNVRLADGN